MLLNSQVCVNELQGASGAWNTTLIHQAFFSIDAEIILNLSHPIAGHYLLVLMEDYPPSISHIILEESRHSFGS
ncbi:hypothetical protein ACOSP7_004196 [Xanthoceras sorbifolium]